jgi:hypothetical protein
MEVSGVFGMHTQFSFLFQKGRKVNQKCLILPLCCQRRRTYKKNRDHKVSRFPLPFNVWMTLEGGPLFCT